jgi:hypothetical protein
VKHRSLTPVRKNWKNSFWKFKLIYFLSSGLRTRFLEIFMCDIRMGTNIKKEGMRMTAG